MDSEKYEKIITVNDQSYENIHDIIQKLIFFMYKENSNKKIEYFRLRLKDSEKSPFSKDLLLEWICPKQPERLSPEALYNKDGSLNNPLCEKCGLGRWSSLHTGCDSPNSKYN